jgi:hypothetical protein
MLLARSALGQFLASAAGRATRMIAGIALIVLGIFIGETAGIVLIVIGVFSMSV